MRQLRYSVAASLDGYVAGPDGEFDWIVIDPEIDFAAMYAGFSGLVMGRRSYEVFVATGGAVYEKGLAGALVDPFSYALAIILVGLLFAGALWSRGVTTFADLFRQRYSPAVERLVVFVLLPGSIFWGC